MTSQPVRVDKLGGSVIHADGCPKPDLSGVQFQRLDNGGMHVRCTRCQAAEWLPDGSTAPVRLLSSPRYVLECCRCSRLIARWNNRPVVPLCDRCKAGPPRRDRA